MLSDYENDFLGLSFNVGSNNFLNVRLDISSIDLSTFGGPFVSPGAVPVFEFSLYDNPTGVTGLGSGTVLDALQASGTASAQTVFDWKEVLLPLDATGNTNGNVTLRIDLLAGGYAAMDNFLIAASDIKGDVGGGGGDGGGGNGSIPEPASLALLGIGLAGLGFTRRRRKA